MANAVVLRSAVALVNKRLRILGQDRLLNGGTAWLFDTKPALYPVQNNTFSGIREGVSGRTMPFVPGTVAPVTFTGNMFTLPPTLINPAGLGIGAYTDPGIDLAVRQAAGSSRFLYIGWAKFSAAGNTTNRPLFYVGQNGVAPTSPQAQLRLTYTNTGLNIFVAGQSFLGMFVPVLDTVYQIGLVIDVNSATGFTTVTLYVGTNSTGPIKIGSYTLPYVAFSAMTATGGASLGISPYATTAVAAPSGCAFGRMLLEDLTQSQRDPERQLLLDSQLNQGRFT